MDNFLTFPQFEDIWSQVFDDDDFQLLYDYILLY